MTCHNSLAVPAAGFLDIVSGELLPATVENAAQVIGSCRVMKERVNDLVTEATAFLAAEAARVGTKTLYGGHTKITLTGGVQDEYDPQDLMEALRAADCPEARIEEAVVPTITYKVNRSVLRQLAAANPDYAAAIELARTTVEKPYRASVATNNKRRESGNETA